MTQKVRSLLTLRPELDGVGERVHGLAVAADEGAAEVDIFETMLFRLQIRDLANVIADEGMGDLACVMKKKGGPRGGEEEIDEEKDYKPT